MKKYIRVIIYAILFTLLIGTFIYLGKKDFTVDKNQSDGERFALEYKIDKENPFVYSYGAEIVDIIKNRTGLIYLGFSSNDWSRYYVRYLNEVLEANNVKKVYYYDLLKDRVKYTKPYRELEELLTDYLYELDSGKIAISTPAFIIVNDGKIVYFDDETAIERNNITPDYYWTNEKIEAFKSRIDSIIKEVNIYE